MFLVLFCWPRFVGFRWILDEEKKQLYPLFFKAAESVGWLLGNFMYMIARSNTLVSSLHMPCSLENSLRIRRRRYSSTHVERRRNHEKRPTVQFLARLSQSLQIKQFAYPSLAPNLTKGISDLPIGIPHPASMYSCIKTPPSVGGYT